ncbi:PAS domain S-box protein [Ottowia beijingensis]|uniref:PAS domain S-box protein n=1 Tax=Ottowia beijingensis TaxID=1207057 RepID=A0A853IX22_9BURK|nr:PAS domain S-box protein [Ottowia beijingensis]NZA01960.1 PAS domain S-box protein [Ottowia beijingensis]
MPIDTEVRFSSPDATGRWMRFIGEASTSSAGEVLEIHGAVQDVSTRRQAQEETVRLAMRLTTTLASINEAFVTLDRQSQFMYVNRESEQLLGHTTGELLGEPVHRWLVGQTPGLLQEELEGALARNERTEFEDFYPALKKWIEVRAHPYAEGLAVYFRDVTERRLAQEQLMLLQTGIARLNDIVLIVEAVGGDAGQTRIAFVNDAFERQTGFSRKDVVGKGLGVLAHGVGADTLSELITGLAHPDTFTVRRREMLLQHRDGSTYWMDLDAVPVRASDGQITHWVAVGRDVTARKQADEKSTTWRSSTR